MKEKDWDKDWLYFTKRARRGVFVLLTLFIIIAIFPRFYDNYFYKPIAYKVGDIVTENPSKEIVEKSHKQYVIPEKPFNPNTIDKEGWMRIGLSEKQAQMIINYLKSGAILKTKSDVKKLYPITDELYNLLEPMIDLPTTRHKEEFAQYENNTESKKESPISIKNNLLIPISINTATEEELLQVKGIGPFFAREIIKLRDAYGGLISLNQLLTIYKMDKERLDLISPMLIVNESEIKKININSASLERLKRHPLITIDMAKSLVYYREHEHPFKTVDEIMLTPYIDKKVYLEIKPYLTVD
ncbi:MAG: helix-hairpin-helix domain-containing protein [Brumimicrobium sp.]|nr:helix-hairpin-helix domain-containing protein [Brumimicrobium sp.]